MNKNLVLWSPGIRNHVGWPSANTGDLIIEESVENELRDLFPGWSLDKVSTHRRLGPGQRKKMRRADLIVIGGSNLLSSYMDRYFQWDLTLANAWAARGAVLMGAGWWRDQGPCNRYTKLLLNIVLSRRFGHSVRDSQAKDQLEKIFIPKVWNTACPTMWPLMEKDTTSIRTAPGKEVLCMLTDYNKEPETDLKLLKLLSARYEKVYFWPQGREDLEYIQELGFGGEILEGTLNALDELLREQTNLDYVGTRLHGGVRCLRAGKRCLTLEVDNRAREVGRDTGLPTVERSNLKAIAAWTNGSEPVRLRIPGEAVSAWKKQFEKLVNG